jgi:hypothetical protein
VVVVVDVDVDGPARRSWACGLMFTPARSVIDCLVRNCIMELGSGAHRRVWRG